MDQIWGSDSNQKIDFLNKKKLFPVIAGLEKATPSQKRKLGDVYFKRVLENSDLDAVLDASPHTLVVGTGSSGRLKIAEGLSAELGKRGIRLEAIPTELAIMRFEELCGLEGEENVALALHLTC
jgi:hypothetical protein